MEGYSLVAVDTSKAVFTLHGVDGEGRATLRRDLGRRAFEAFMARLGPCEVVLEASGASHHWGRVLSGMGHRVRLLPPQYVKPFVRRGKTDRGDAQAIAEASARPGLRTVPVRSLEASAGAVVLRTRELLVRQRTMLVNALRGHAAEFGVVAPRGLSRVEGLLEAVAGHTGVPELARRMLVRLGEEVARLDEAIGAVEAELLTLHRASGASRRLEAVPGVGPITAVSLALGVEAGRFESGRHFAAWLGLTPREHSSGGKRRLGGISRAGNERLRQLLVVGATAVIRHARPGGRNASPWLLALMARKPRKLAAVALANKTARIVWAMLSRGEAYRRPGPPLGGDPVPAAA